MNINTTSPSINLQSAMSESSSRFSDYLQEQVSFSNQYKSQDNLNNVEDILIDMAEEMKICNRSYITADKAVEAAIQELSKNMKSIPAEVIEELHSCAIDLCSSTSYRPVNVIS